MPNVIMTKFICDMYVAPISSMFSIHSQVYFAHSTQFEIIHKCTTSSNTTICHIQSYTILLAGFHCSCTMHWYNNILVENTIVIASLHVILNCFLQFANCPWPNIAFLCRILVYSTNHFIYFLAICQRDQKREYIC